MTPELLLRLFFTAFISMLIGYEVFARYDDETGEEKYENEPKRYRPYINGVSLPILIIILAAVYFLYYDAAEAVHHLLSLCFTVSLHAGLYYLLLTSLLPVLRKHISARTCAMLWMLPNFLYIMYYDYQMPGQPLWLISVPGHLIRILAGLWLLGFIAVLAWKIISHLLFRRRILKDAVPVADESILEIWQAELLRMQLKSAKFRLVTSPNVSAPLTIGLFVHSVIVVLPKQDYSPEDLTLIFRHEIIHIGREDAWTKFSLVFCSAMCWFNPLIWWVIRKSADDLEVSCDETVLLDADEKMRHHYASLILDTAGDERGFTTCLSASAAALRYRLKKIMKPAKHHSGALVTALFFFVLCMTNGHTALAYGNMSGSEIIYQSEGTEVCSLQRIVKPDTPTDTDWTCIDEDAFHQYMADLKLQRITGKYSFSDTVWHYKFQYSTPEGIIYVSLSEHMMRIESLYRMDIESIYYHIKEGVDLEYMNTLILSSPEQ